MIKNRIWHQILAFVAVTIPLAAALWAHSSRGTQNLSTPSFTHPSVLLITLDTVRADHLGCYGYSRIETPTIDRLAAEGVRFSNAYAQAPITLPSHAVILTGTYPMFNGLRDFTSPSLRGDIPTLADIVRRNGYRTAAFVSSFVLNSMWGLNRGFEVYDDNVGFDPMGTNSLFLLERRGDRTVDRFLEWLNRRDAKPFFVWLHLYDPHSPYRPPEPYRTKYSSHPYDGEIAFDDIQVGRVVARLRSLNLYENTLILLLSDHGESLGEHGEDEHGFFVYNATLHVPLILKLPGQASKGSVVGQPVGTVDVSQTVAQICRIPPDETRSFQGRSLLRTFDNKNRADEAVYAESYYPSNSFGWHELRALITPEFKYIEAPRPELYDLKRDPLERTNFFGQNSAEAASLRERLMEYERRFQSRQASSPAAPLDPETLEKLKSLGYVAYKAGTAEKGDDAHRADPKNKITSLNRILRAGDLTRLGRYPEADHLLAGLEQAESDLYVVPFERGENYLAWGKPQQALAEFRKSLSRNPAFDQAALGLGRAYFLVGRDVDAAKALELALRFGPQNFLARLALAKVYWRQNRLGEAEPELAKVVTAHPEFPEAHADYGIILAKVGKYREALLEIRKGIELGYKDPFAYNYLGVASAQLGDHSQAVRAYEQAVELNPRYAAAYLNLALEFRRQGQLARALSYYRKTCERSEELCREYTGQFSTPQ